MCSKKLEKEIHDLYALVSNLDPNESADDGYIEIVEIPTASKPPSQKASSSPPPKVKPIIPPRRPPQAPHANFFERSFSFNGALSRGYFGWSSAVLLVCSVVIISLIDAREIDEGWGILMLAVLGWSFLATLIKRWRDTGYNMWWLFTLLLPYVGIITALFVFFAPSRKTP